MKNLIQGIQNIESMVFAAHRELFEHLEDGPAPEKLLITCSDSRVDPNLIAQTKPGELFILSDAGSIVPAYGMFFGGEQVTIEFTLVGLGMTELAVCCHSHCGVIQELLNLESIREKRSAMGSTFVHAEATQQIIREKYTTLSDADRLNLAIQENVRQPLEYLLIHSPVASGLARGEISLHGWVYTIERNPVSAYDPEQGQCLVLTEQTSLPITTFGHLKACCSI